MSVPDPGLAAFATANPAPAAPPARPAKPHAATAVALADRSEPVAPDQFDPAYATTRRERYAYYAYYIGANGLSLFNFAPTQFQNLLAQAADPATGLLPFAGAARSVNAVVLLCNGFSFAIQVVLFLVLGSYADFGSWRPNILIVLSVAAYAIGFGWLGVRDASAWQAGAGLYIVGLIAYQTTLTFWTAAFPGLARNSVELREKAAQLARGEIGREEYDRADSMKRSELSNVAFYVQSVFQLISLAVIVGILFALNVTASDENNNWGYSVIIAFVSGVWLVLSVPWFVWEKRRPGLNPQGNIVLAGLKQLVRACRMIWTLRQSLIYLIGYFLLGDALNTTVTVISTLQAELVSYSAIQTTYLLLVGIAAQAVGIGAFWWLQRRFNLSAHVMFNAVAVAIVLLDIWGMIGIWTNKFGFHNVWETWAYQAFYGLFVCPWYSYSQIMISEVTPRGYEFIFFSLFSIMGKTSSFIAPLVSSAIISATPDQNTSTPFYFLFGLSLLSSILLFFFLDLNKSQREQDEFLAREERKRGLSSETSSS